MPLPSLASSCLHKRGKSKELFWEGVQGEEWETLLPPYAGGSVVKHRSTPTNKTVKVKTVEPLATDEGFEISLDMGGMSHYHEGGPAVRIMWGDLLSVIFRGEGARAYAQVEQRDRGKWQVLLVLSQNGPLSRSFWSNSHLLRIGQLAGKLIVELDGFGYHLTLKSSFDNKAQPIPVTWPAAPIHISIIGAAVMFGVTRFSRFEADDKTPRGVVVKRVLKTFKRKDEEGAEFEFQGRLTKSTDKSTGSLAGSGLEEATATGIYRPDGTVEYEIKMQCGPNGPPILSSLAVQFAISEPEEMPDPVDLRPAVIDWQVDGGNPDKGEGGEASFTLSRAMLDRFIPDWKTVVAPFRRVVITLEYPLLHEPEVLFRGWIRPNNFDVSDYADASISVVCGDMISERLNESAGLIDERFGPLDLAINESKHTLFGAEAVQHLLRIILGQEVADKINGDGNPLRYLASGCAPLLSTAPSGGGLAEVLQMKMQSSFYFPPPFGESAASWIEKIAGYDYAVYFYEPRDDAFIYGDLEMILGERGQQVYDVSADTITQLSNQGEFERAYNDVRVWGESPAGAEALMPSLMMGRAGDSGAPSEDPTSKAQSWQRTLLMKPEIVRPGMVSEEWVQELAYRVWAQFENALPASYRLEFDFGVSEIRWGESIRFVAPGETTPKIRCVTKVIHRGNLSGGNGSRFSTSVEARSLAGDEI